MQRFLVTGGNKGIGLAIVRGLLNADKFVYLGCRDVARGDNAAKKLVAENSEFADRLQTLQLDVTDEASVTRAAETVRGCEERLSAIVHNAGTTPENFSPTAAKQCLDVNFHGAVRVTEAFLSALDTSSGRIVVVSSSAGPSFVSKCSPERQRLLMDPKITMSQIKAFIDEYITTVSKGGVPSEQMADAGLGDASPMSIYGMSKACVNSYTQLLARENPSLLVNACTPGMIDTDLLRSVSQSMGIDIGVSNAKTPDEGAKPPIYLAIGDVPGSGWYFGSDCKRSPLDCYREPGSPAYEGK